MAIIGIASVVAVSAGFAALVKKTADYGDAIGKMAKRTGMSVEFLQKLKHAAELGGGSLEDMEKAVRRVSQAAVDSSDGLLTYKRIFDRLGVAYTDNNGKFKSSERLFLDVAEALSKVENSTERVAIATKLLGRSGTRILPMLTDGVDQFLKDMKEAESLGLIMSAQDVKNAERFKDEMLRTKGLMSGIGRGFAMRFIPAINTALVAFRAKMKQLQDEGVFADFGDSFSSGVSLLIAAGEAFLKASNKMAVIGDIILAAFQAGGELAGLGIRKAFEDTAAGRAGKFVKRRVQATAALFGGGSEASMKALKGGYDKTAKDIQREFKESMKTALGIKAGDINSASDLMKRAAEIQSLLGGAGNGNGQAENRRGTALRSMGANWIGGAGNMQQDVERKQLSVLQMMQRDMAESVRLMRERLLRRTGPTQF